MSLPVWCQKLALLGSFLALAPARADGSAVRVCFYEASRRYALTVLQDERLQTRRTGVSNYTVLYEAQSQAATAEVRLANSEIGFVRPGQAVTVKVHAFPFSRHGTIAGQIVSIGATAIPDDRLGLAYPVRVRLDPAAARRFRLRPGMAVTADMRTGTRSLLEYLVGPVQRAAATAGRER